MRVSRCDNICKMLNTAITGSTKSSSMFTKLQSDFRQHQVKIRISSAFMINNLQISSHFSAAIWHLHANIFLKYINILTIPLFRKDPQD